MSEAVSSDRFETVAWVYSQSDLAILLSVLTHADMHVQRIGQGNAAADPGLTTALGGVELRVHEEDAADARAILAELDRPYRAPLLFGILPFDLIFFLVVGFLGMAPPPRQMPCFATGAVAARAETD